MESFRGSNTNFWLKVQTKHIGEDVEIRIINRYTKIVAWIVPFALLFMFALSTVLDSDSVILIFIPLLLVVVLGIAIPSVIHIIIDYKSGILTVRKQYLKESTMVVLKDGCRIHHISSSFSLNPSRQYGEIQILEKKGRVLSLKDFNSENEVDQVYNALIRFSGQRI